MHEDMHKITNEENSFMKSIRIIQVLAKIARVICIIVFVCSIVGAVGCMVGLIVLPLCKDIVVSDGKTLAELLIEKDMPLYKVYCALAVGLTSCGVSIFLAKYNELFYKREIEIGTPFNKEVVRDMRKTAIVNIITSLVLVIACSIAVAVVSNINKADMSFKFEYFSSIGYGITLLILSLFCDYGAELNQKQE